MIEVNDDLLYAHMPKASENRFNQIPLEKELNHKFSKRFERKMTALLKYEKQAPLIHSFIGYSKNVAAVFLVFISIAFALTMSVEAYRIRFFEIITTVWEDFTSIIYESDDSTDNEQLIPVEPSYIPDDFSVYHRENTKYRLTMIYRNTDEKDIYYSQKLLTQSENIIDTEDAIYEVIKVGIQDVTILQNKDSVRVQWTDLSNSYSIISTSDNKQNLIKMSESIINKK